MDMPASILPPIKDGGFGETDYSNKVLGLLSLSPPSLSSHYSI